MVGFYSTKLQANYSDLLYVQLEYVLLVIFCMLSSDGLMNKDLQ